MGMKRRSFLTASAAAIAFAPAAPAIAQSQPDVKWRLSSSYPKSLDILQGSAVRIAKRVAELTDGHFQIQTFAAGEIVPPLQVLDAVQNGTIEAGGTPSFFYVGKDPTFAFDTAIPFGLNTRQQTAWVLEGGGLQLMRDFYKSYKYSVSGRKHWSANGRMVQKGDQESGRSPWSEDADCGTWRPGDRSTGCRAAEHSPR
jgi:TRAP-type mannitol/chloroaromatic compound transport system substrate-binding protein